jgi:hypothetical protein
MERFQLFSFSTRETMRLIKNLMCLAGEANVTSFSFFLNHAKGLRVFSLRGKV